ncbi:MAG: transketolase C-terminal domain-containing protein [Ilumatobacteraceae bacterium]
MTTKRMTFGQATLEAMQFAMDEDPNVIVVGEDISWGGNFGQFRGLIDRYGESRVVDMPISESLIVALSVGAAVAGLKVVASMSFVEFTLGAMDEIVNQASKFRYMFGGQTSVPIVLRASDGIRGSSGSQHSSSLEGLFCNIPGLKVVAPSNGNDAKGLLRAAIADPDPVVYLEHKKITGQRAAVIEGDFFVPLGSATVAREGADISVVTYSNMVNIALEAATVLEDEAISVEVIDLRSLVPLDVDTIAMSARKTGIVLAAHESWTFGGFGAEILAQVREALPEQPELCTHRLGARSAPIPFSPALEPAVVPGISDLIAEIRRIVGR